MIVVIDGPSCAGKSTVIKELMDYDERAVFIPSHTTRTKRNGESEANPYYFISREKFEDMKDDFIEYSEIHGNMYGKSKTVIDNVIGSKRFPLLDIDSQGLKKYLKIYKRENILSIFITAPEDVIAERMLKRDGEINEIRIINGRKENRFYKRHSNLFDVMFDTSEVTIESIVNNIIYLMNEKTNRVSITSTRTARVDWFIYYWRNNRLTVYKENMNNNERSEIVNEIYRLFRLETTDNFKFKEDKVIIEDIMVRRLNIILPFIPKVF